VIFLTVEEGRKEGKREKEKMDKRKQNIKRKKKVFLSLCVTDSKGLNFFIHLRLRSSEM
jgi:hypothetical protein